MSKKLKIKVFGAAGNILCQIPRIITGLKELGHELVEDESCDFIFCNDPSEFEFAINYKKKYPNSKLILNILDCPIHIRDFNNWKDKVGMQLFFADKITCISETVKKHLFNIFPFVQQKWGGVIYNPIKPVYPLNLERNNRFLFVSRACDLNKRFSIALELAAMLNKTIDVVGHENPTNISKPNLQKYINYLGELSDEELNKAYNNHELVMVTGKIEGLSLSLIESLCTKTPVICLEDMDTALELCPKEFISKSSIYDLYNKYLFIKSSDPIIKKKLDEYSEKYLIKFSPISIANNIIKVYENKS